MLLVAYWLRPARTHVVVDVPGADDANFSAFMRLVSAGGFERRRSAKARISAPAAAAPYRSRKVRDRRISSRERIAYFASMEYAAEVAHFSGPFCFSYRAAMPLMPDGTLHDDTQRDAGNHRLIFIFHIMATAPFIYAACHTSFSFHRLQHQRRASLRHFMKWMP